MHYENQMGKSKKFTLPRAVRAKGRNTYYSVVFLSLNVLFVVIQCQCFCVECASIVRKV